MSPSCSAVTGPVLPCEVYRILWIFWEMTSVIFRVLVCFVRQWLHDHASSTESLSGPFSPYSALSLIRQRIHVLRLSMELLKKLIFSGR